MKYKNQRLTLEMLKSRISEKYGKAKWIEFCEILLKQGYKLKLYEAKYTYSKYIMIFKGNKSYKVRFSDHKPILQKELDNDCDFFVGVSNLGITTTKDALNAVAKHFKKSEVA